MSDGYFDEEGPGEHDKHLLDRNEGENDTVPCPQCGTTLLAFADCCHHCGAEFGQEAWLARGEGRFPMLWGALALLALVAMALWLMR